MKIKWCDPTWSYLLGVVHGDGNISTRSIRVSVSYRDQDYAEALIRLWKVLGYNAKTYRPRSSLAIDVHSIALRNMFAPFKVHGKWSWPSRLSWSDYLAGVIDTDGCVTLNKSIVISLKRNGNLFRLATEINKMGVRKVAAKPTTSTYDGKKYETETIVISGMDRIVQLCTHITLRHPRKVRRLATMLMQIAEIQARVPVHQQVAEWLHGEGQTWKEIAEQFQLTHAQVESVLCLLRKNGSLEVLPPMAPLHRYRTRAR